MINKFDILYMSSDEEDYELSDDEDNKKILSLIHPDKLEVNKHIIESSSHTPEDPPPKKQKLFHNVIVNPINEIIKKLEELFKDKS